MATRLYFTATDAAPISPGFCAWTRTADGVRRNLSTSKAAATETISGTIGGAAGNNSLAAQLVSPPLDGAQTILNTGTWSGTGRGRELATTDNIDQKVRCIKVYSNDGSTLRGTLVALAAAGNTTELTTSLAGNQYANGGGLTQVAAQDGDRIVVELGFGEVGTGTTPQWEFVLGGNGTDHAIAQGDTTGTVAWVEFSQNLVFRSAVGDDSQLVWDVRSALGDTSQFVWDVRTALGDTSQLVWDVRAALGDILQAVWDVRAAIGDTSQFAWDVRTPVADLLQLVWDVLENVPMTPIGDELILLWNVLAPPSQYFRPPTVAEVYKDELWSQDHSSYGKQHIRLFKSIPRGLTLLKENGVWTLGRYFSEDRVVAADRAYRGGRVYGPLTVAEIVELTAAGYGEFITTEGP